MPRREYKLVFLRLARLRVQENRFDKSPQWKRGKLMSLSREQSEKIEFVMDNRDEVFQMILIQFRYGKNAERNEIEFKEISAKLDQAIPELLEDHTALPCIVALLRVIDLLIANSIDPNFKFGERVQ